MDWERLPVAPCTLTSELTVHMLKYCKEGTFVVLSSTTLLLLLLLLLLHVALKCSSQRINVCRLWIRKKTLKSRDFPDFTWCWSAIELQKYNTRSLSDTSDTSYLQKCSRNIVCYFWSPCRTSYSSKKSLFFHLYIPPSHSLSSSNTPLHPGNRQILLSPGRGT